MTGAEILTRLSHRGLFRIKPGLDRMQAVMGVLGDPQDSYASIHIAGTNGKGSVAAGLESVLRAAGYKTGLYISPHLQTLRERIQINARPVEQRRFEIAAETVARGEAIAGVKLTYFEYLTAMAFATFRESAVDIAIVEVGLGGLWDATNVLRAPELSLITSIGMDHKQWLGKNRQTIALQKAGIIKPHGTVISGVRGAPGKKIADVARRRKARLIQLGSDFQGKRLHTYWQKACQTGRYEEGGRFSLEFTLGLLGKHQIDNASLVIAAARVLATKGWVISQSSILEGLRHVRWPGRFDLRRRPGRAAILFDGAHNPDAMRVFLKTLRESPWNKVPKTLVFSAFADKDYKGMARLLGRLPERIVLCRLSGTRGLEMRQLRKAFAKTKASVTAMDSPEAALRRAITLTPKGGLVIVTGSLALVGLLLKENGASRPNLGHPSDQRGMLCLENSL